MKAFTDLEQSRKLAGILPVESADMCFNDNEPCWSLVALLNYLREVDFFPEIDADEFEVTMNISFYDVEDECRLVPIHSIDIKAESFIDACVELIFKLKERDLI